MEFRQATEFHGSNSKVDFASSAAIFCWKCLLRAQSCESTLTKSHTNEYSGILKASSQVSMTTTYYYRTWMTSSAKTKSFCEVPKYVINTRPHCPKLMKFTCYTYVQSCNTESCIATIAIQLPKVDQDIIVTA